MATNFTYDLSENQITKLFILKVKLIKMWTLKVDLAEFGGSLQRSGERHSL